MTLYFINVYIAYIIDIYKVCYSTYIRVHLATRM